MSIIANQFMFCAPHGLEWCHHCGVDHRMGNNTFIAKEIMTILESRGDDLDFDVDDRTPINLFSRALVPLGEPWDSDDPIPCAQHTQVDCKTCFDWVKLVTDEI
ncbi:hypothetical protein DFH28DRAFT_926278 [Melampsora americana]|nr:hypothetical protein DFH28DRAFT_926278 [Melampsora americana]